MDRRLNPDYEISVATRGNCAGVLAGLISHAVHRSFNLRIVTAAHVTEPALLETLVHFFGPTLEISFCPQSCEFLRLEA